EDPGRPGRDDPAADRDRLPGKPDGVPRLMRILDLLAARAATATGALGELAVLAMFAHMALDLIIRLVGGGTPEGMPEAVARIYMVMVVFLPLAGLQASGRQIEVAVLAER